MAFQLVDDACLSLAKRLDIDAETEALLVLPNHAVPEVVLDRMATVFQQRFPKVMILVATDPDKVRLVRLKDKSGV